MSETKIYKTTTVQVPINLHQLARVNLIPFNEALSLGIRFILAERELGEYPRTKLYERLAKYKSLSETLSQEVYELKEKLANLKLGKEENLTADEVQKILSPKQHIEKSLIDEKNPEEEEKNPAR